MLMTLSLQASGLDLDRVTNVASSMSHPSVAGGEGEGGTLWGKKLEGDALDAAGVSSKNLRSISDFEVGGGGGITSGRTRLNKRSRRRTSEHVKPLGASVWAYRSCALAVVVAFTSAVAI